MGDSEALTAPAPLHAIAADLRDGRVELAAYLSELCTRIDRDDPRILSLLPEPDRRGRLLAEAAALEARDPDPQRRPALYGVPVGVKDVIRVDSFRTRGGSSLPPELFDGPEAACVTRLKEAGALVLKTVTTEFALMEPAATRNPHRRDHSPGGSSSGSAAAVAAGFVPLALGTQTVGSVIRPAAYCGIVGFKPSFDRIPTEGILYCSRSLDHVGLFTQEAAGMTLAASVLLDGLRDEAHAAQAGHIPTIGVPDGPYLEQAQPAALRAFEEQLGRLERAGCLVRRVPALEDIDAIARRHLWLMTAELAREHEAWFARYGALYRPRTATMVERGREVTAEQLEAGRRGRLELRDRLHRLMDEQGIDVWASPPAPGPAPAGLASIGSAAMNLPWTQGGLPTITLPAGSAGNGLPLGLQLSARFMADEQLLAWAEALEPVL